MIFQAFTKSTAVLAIGISLAACAHHSKAPTTAAIPGPGPEIVGKVETVYALQYVDIEVGTGPEVLPGRKVTVHYTGWLKDNTKFDSSHDRSTPLEVVVGAGRVIKGWDHGLVGMREGGKRRLIIPHALAYGDNARGSIPPKSDLTFDVELIRVDSVLPGPGSN